jgi:hypothetical protein
MQQLRIPAESGPIKPLEKRETPGSMRESGGSANGSFQTS